MIYAKEAAQQREREGEGEREERQRECNQRNAGTANAASIAILSYFD